MSPKRNEDQSAQSKPDVSASAVVDSTVDNSVGAGVVAFVELDSVVVKASVEDNSVELASDSV